MNLQVVELNGKVCMHYEHFHGTKPLYAMALWEWGEAGTVKIGKNGKVGDRGIPMIFIGYAKNHAKDCYRMYDPSTRMINQTRDVMWLCRMYYPKDPELYDIVSEPIVAVPVEEGDASVREGDTCERNILPEAQVQDPSTEDSDSRGSNNEGEWIHPRYTTQARRQVIPPARYQDYNVNGIESMLTSIPQNYYAEL